MIKSLFENWINFNIPAQTVEDVLFAELEADNDELAVRRLKLEIGKKVYDAIMNEINLHLTF